MATTANDAEHLSTRDDGGVVFRATAHRLPDGPLRGVTVDTGREDALGWIGFLSASEVGELRDWLSAVLDG